MAGPSSNGNGTLNLSQVIEEPPYIGSDIPSLVINFAQAADSIPAWGTAPATRDIKLREFWPTEPLLAGALYTTISKYVAFSWELVGPIRTCAIVQNMLHYSDLGNGWNSLMIKVLLDLFTQDNGAFIEMARTRDDYTAPVVQLNHLDSGRCIRTGNTEFPILYKDLKGRLHKMPWYSVIDVTEMPSPIETARGMQYCALTRLLAAAQIIRDIEIYKHEKISGRFYRSVHLVGGVQAKTINDVLVSHREHADNVGLIRYIQPAIVAALDPTATVSHAQIDLSSLPDGFDQEVEYKWYINQFALAFGGDFQDYGPLPGHNLGTAQQSQVLHAKGRGKGPALFMSLMEHKLNFHGALPQTVMFKFGEQDIGEQAAVAELRKLRADERSVRIASGEITPQIAQQIAVDDGDLKPEYLAMMGTIPDIRTQIVPGSVPADTATLPIVVTSTDSETAS